MILPTRVFRQIACILVLLMGMSSGALAQGQLEGTLIVLNKQGHDASFIDLASGNLVTTLPTGRGPHELIATRDGRWAIGTDYSGGDSLTVFQVSGPGVAGTIDLSATPRPHGIVFLPGENEVVVTSEASSNLVVVDYRSGEVVRVIDTTQSGSHMVAITADGSTAVTSNMGDDSVSVIDIRDGTVRHILDVPDRPEAITISRQGHQVWVGSNDEGVVSVLDTNSGELLAQWQGFNWPYRILLDADERLAVIPDLGNETLRFFDARTFTEIASMDFAGQAPQGVIWHPNNQVLFLSLAGADKVVAIDTGSRSVIAEYNTGNSPDGLALSAIQLQR